MSKRTRTLQEHRDLLNETKDYYTSENRGFDEVGRACSYRLNKGGPKCAVGRCFDKDKIKAFLSWDIWNFQGSVGALEVELLSDPHPCSLDEILQDKYKGFGVKFWAKIQDLHDSSNFWNEDGLNNSGLIEFRRITYYIEGLFD